MKKRGEDKGFKVNSDFLGGPDLTKTFPLSFFFNVTRSGNFLDFGQLFKDFGNN